MFEEKPVDIVVFNEEEEKIWKNVYVLLLFVAGQKVREIKCRIAKLSVLKMKVPPTTIILQSAENMNNIKSKK